MVSYPLLDDPECLREYGHARRFCLVCRKTVRETPRQPESHLLLADPAQLIEVVELGGSGNAGYFRSQRHLRVRRGQRHR